MYYFSQLRIGAVPAEDGVETSFGQGGSTIARLEPSGCAPGPGVSQTFHRISLWGGRPVFVGNAEGGCESEATDVLVGRLSLDRIFDDGFE